MKQYDVIIIGGGPSGIITGVTGIKQNPGKKFLMFKEEEKGLVPCGIPYILHDLNDVDKNTMGPAPFIEAGGEVSVDPVTSIDFERKTLKTKSETEYAYDKLVFATGSVPIIPKFIKGYDLANVEYISKSYNHIKALKAKTDSAKNIVIIGAGFIGVEVAEQLAKYKDKEVHLVEMQNHCLCAAFSEKLSSMADSLIQDQGVKLHTSRKVMEIAGIEGKANAVLLDDGTKLAADLVIIAIGYRPNTDLAKASGLDLNCNKAIVVDNYLRCQIKDVFAVGDCSQSIGFITGRADNIMLASTATAEARILGYNLFSIKLLRNFSGTLSVFATQIGPTVLASAGAIKQAADAAGISYICGEFEDVDRHPGAISDACQQYVSLIVSLASGAIIGSEICGCKSAGELINVVGLAIQKRVTVYELISYQIGTHPLLTAAPTKYVLIKAAENAVAKLKKAQG